MLLEFKNFTGSFCRNCFTCNESFKFQKICGKGEKKEIYIKKKDKLLSAVSEFLG